MSEIPFLEDNHMSSVVFGPTQPPISMQYAKNVVGAVCAVFASAGLGSPTILATSEEKGNSVVGGNQSYIVICHSRDHEADSPIMIEVRSSEKSLVGDMSSAKAMMLFIKLPNIVSHILTMCDAMERGNNNPTIFAIPLDFSENAQKGADQVNADLADKFQRAFGKGGLN